MKDITNIVIVLTIVIVFATFAKMSSKVSLGPGPGRIDHDARIERVDRELQLHRHLAKAKVHMPEHAEQCARNISRLIRVKVRYQKEKR